MSQNFRDLKVWQRAMELTTKIYQLTSSFPDAEKYGLTSQMRRVASSIPANIAEGRERFYAKDFQRFISIASSSVGESETFLELSVKLNF